jgi:presqualene diphosphate synthase
MTAVLPIPAPVATPLAGDVAEVSAIVDGAGSSFAAGMRILPRPRREAIYAVYAFCRLVDDVADGEGDAEEKRQGLLWWEEEVARAYGGTPRGAVGREMARAAREHALPREEFDLVVEGMRMDAAAIVAPTPEHLDRYVRCVAGAVGILSLRVFGAWQGERSRRFALSLARAVQLTNILRDVEEDAGLGRLYLPRPVLDAAGVPPDPQGALLHPGLSEARRLLGRSARAEFTRARALARGHPWGRLLPALLMMGPYEALLGRMEADWSQPPLRRPGWAKAAEGAACAGRALLVARRRKV